MSPLVMYTLRRGEDGRLHGPVNKRVFGTFGSRRSALEWARAQATRRGFPPGTTKVVQIVNSTHFVTLKDPQTSMKATPRFTG